MSLVSSLFRHSSKPVTVACFGWAGPEGVAGLKADGRTGETGAMTSQTAETESQGLILNNIAFS